MYLYLKNNANKLRKSLPSLLMVVVLATGSIEIFLPKTSEADFLIDRANLIKGAATSQENTLLRTNPVESVKISKKIKMAITAYSSTIEETDSTPFITASGSTVRDGIVANNLLPFGTKIRVPQLYGDRVFIVEDRMNQKKGKYHLDIWFPNHSDAKKFGSEIAYVEVLEN